MEKFKKIIVSKKSLAPILAALIVGCVIGYAFRGDEPGAGNADAHTSRETGTAMTDDHMHASLNTLETQKKTAVYVCPMNCVPPMEKPGNCPICGMELTVVVSDDMADGAGTQAVVFSEEMLRKAGTRTAPVERKFVYNKVKLYGKIEYDPVEQYKVTAFAPGIIDRIYVKRAGQTVRAGDPLFDMHSSELFVLEQDLFEVLKHFPDPVDYRPARGQIYKRQMRPPRRYIELPKPGEVPDEVLKEKQAAYDKLQQIHRKMMLLGLSKNDIERVMARGLPSGISTVITPTTGVVQEQYAFKGSYVNTGETVFTIANPKYTWARLEGYAEDFRWVRLGQEAEFTVDAHPGEVFRGKVLFLDTEFDLKTRTFEVGVLYNDTENQLRPNMLVRCSIKAKMTAGGVAESAGESSGTPPLVIPETAPLVTGKRAVVYVAIPGTPGAFETRDVALGPRAEGYFVVNNGLEEDEMVVVEGNFKIDSAVQILARPSMMERPGAKMNGHRHGVDTMGDMGMEMDMETETQHETKTHREMRTNPGTRMKMEAGHGKAEPKSVERPVSRRDKIKERLMKLKQNNY